MSKPVVLSSVLDVVVCTLFFSSWRLILFRRLYYAEPVDIFCTPRGFVLWWSIGLTPIIAESPIVEYSFHTSLSLGSESAPIGSPSVLLCPGISSFELCRSLISWSANLTRQVLRFVAADMAGASSIFSTEWIPRTALSVCGVTNAFAQIFPRSVSTAQLYPLTITKPR